MRGLSVSVEDFAREGEELRGGRDVLLPAARLFDDVFREREPR